MAATNRSHWVVAAQHGGVAGAETLPFLTEWEGRRVVPGSRIACTGPASAGFLNAFGKQYRHKIYW